MTTTGELRGIIEELAFVDGGDAESYLGEEFGEGQEEYEGEVCVIGGGSTSRDAEEEMSTFVKELIDVAERSSKQIDKA